MRPCTGFRKKHLEGTRKPYIPKYSEENKWCVCVCVCVSVRVCVAQKEKEGKRWRERKRERVRGNRK